MSTDIATYKYAIVGRHIAILAYDTDEYIYLTPTTSDANGIMIQYSLAAGTVTTETDSIDIDYSLERALIYYVKMRLSEDVGNEAQAIRERAKYYKYMAHSQNNKTGVAVRISTPRGVGVVK